MEQDLIAAVEERDRLAAALAEAETRVASMQFLLSLVDAPAEAVRTSLHEAMRTVLQSTPGHVMPAVELAREINRRGLYRMRDGRPVEAQQIHARVGNRDDFVRTPRGIGLA
ncbi:hypothetical protein [Cellulomonas sp. 73-145]|uniref:hypothetical protein n=1 Tax=Cellulomonas sp. 73-145 TaxID=1895739 RepID=UPI001ACD7D37|nr:hypothetical protein [Cellulomonas sp. 73-145]MBN9327309.1 hypothetical protein [Cellulomonas sp.]